MQILILIFSLLLFGCSLFEAKPRLIQTDFRVIFRFDKQPIPSDGQAVASATWTEGLCIITVRPEYYTHRCLGHELRQCLEGDWHKGRKEPC
jgi:hypothetical protein